MNSTPPTFAKKVGGAVQVSRTQSVLLTLSLGVKSVKLRGKKQKFSVALRPRIFGEIFELKSEPHHRGIKFGFALHFVDNWVQALPAGEIFELKSEPHHRGMKFGFALHSVDNWVQALPAGEIFELKSEPHHRGMKFGFALHSVDNWVQALPAGGDMGARTQDLTDVNRAL